jgi:hypothetical protein
VKRKKLLGEKEQKSSIEKYLPSSSKEEFSHVYHELHRAPVLELSPRYQCP